MLTIARLFGKSPFAPLKTHMNKVASCVKELSSLIKVLPQTDLPILEGIAQKISELEHEADVTKNDIRNHLPNSIFLPIDRGHFLEILSVQDSIADATEKVAAHLALSPLEKYESMAEPFSQFYLRCVETFHAVWEIMEEVDELLESSFGGIEATKVKHMVEDTATKEHHARQAHYVLLKQLLAINNDMRAPALYLWTTVLQGIGEIATCSERLANRIRMILEIK